MDLDEHLMSGNGHAQCAMASTNEGNLFESEGISPGVLFTHPDILPTSGDGDEDALGSTPCPEHTGDGNGRLHAAEATNSAADENRPGHIHVPNTDRTSRLTYTELGSQSGHDNPDTSAAPGESGRNPNGANNAGTNRPGHSGEHAEADATAPNGDTSGAADANPREHTAALDTGVGLGDIRDPNQRNGHSIGGSDTNGAAVANTGNQNGAPDAGSNYSAPDAGVDHGTITRAGDGNASGHGKSRR